MAAEGAEAMVEGAQAVRMVVRVVMVGNRLLRHPLEALAEAGRRTSSRLACMA